MVKWQALGEDGESLPINDAAVSLTESEIDGVPPDAYEVATPEGHVAVVLAGHTCMHLNPSMIGRLGLEGEYLSTSDSSTT